MSMNNSNDIIGNRTRVLPACSAVPHPTVSARLKGSGAHIHHILKTLISSVFHPHGLPMCITEFSHQTAIWADRALCFTEWAGLTIQTEVPARPSVYGWFPFHYHKHEAAGTLIQIKKLKFAHFI